MTWAETMPFEVELEFLRLMAMPWEHVENRVWQQLQSGRAKWQTHGRWWRKTARGKAYHRTMERKRYLENRSRVVAVRGCEVCGHSFELTKTAEARKRRTCSARCAAVARAGTVTVVVNGARVPAVSLAAKLGISSSRLHGRIKAGWDPYRAATTPARAGKYGRNGAA